MKDSIKFWDNRAEKFDSSDSSETDMLVEKSIIFLSEDNVVLDFACGTGTSTVGFAGFVKSIQGIDLSKNMIGIGNKKVKDSTLSNVTFEVATIDNEHFAKESFDGIIAFNILHLLEDTDSTIKRISELLKPGGVFISNTVCIGEKKSIVRFLIMAASKIGMVPKINPFSGNELEDMLLDAGFSVVLSEMTDESVPNAYIVAKKTDAK